MENIVCLKHKICYSIIIFYYLKYYWPDNHELD